ncbi:hypothetical protein KVV02_005706 [Mortierella alpina]|uniref:WD40 repeat-like protein n=1 Tax=Mortierella alpina TaxID=64518 RepID=A0A9P8AB79_MORAP|nr:hypothetical protein KVV02_005706 [Mortierella alpina]
MKNQPLQSRLNHSPASLFVLSTRSTGVVAAVAVGLAAASRPHMAGLSNGGLLLSMGALQCLWLGANLAISFLEAPVKFLAPTPARRGLIDVGRHVFSALNKVEVALASFDLLGWYLIMRRGLFPAVSMSGSSSLASNLWQMGPHLAPGLIVYALQSFFFLPMMRSVGLRYIEGKPTESAKVHGVYVLLEVLKVSTLTVSTVGIARALLRQIHQSRASNQLQVASTSARHLAMDTPESRPITQRKRSYSTTAYSSQEEEAAFVNNKPDQAQASLPTCLLATTAGNQLICYEFINNGNVSSTAASKQSQPPIAIPGQYDGIKMSGVKLSHGVSSLKWSPDNTMLAIEGHDGRVSLHDSRGRLQESLVTDPVLEDSRAGSYRCAMSWAPKPQRLYLAHGRKVMTWDAVQRRSTEAFETGSRINALAINADDTLLAIGQNNGALEVVNRTSGSGAKLDTPEPLVMSRIEYSVFNRSVLGGVGNDGILRLWDTGSNGATALYHSFAATHELPISGMAFSPFNRYLICTAGLDKRYALYDVEKKNVVKNTVTDYALTSVSFKNDGISMAFGTDQGKVLLYDLRSTSRPISVVDTQTDAPITSIQFQGKLSSSLKRHQTINGHALKRQNSTGTKTAVFSTKDSPFDPTGITQVNTNSGKEAAPRSAPAKAQTLSQPSLNLLSGSHREWGERELQSAGANGRGILDFFSSKRGTTTTQPIEGAASLAGTERTQSKARRPTAPATIFTSGATLASSSASVLASRSSLPATPSAPAPEYGSIPHTPARKQTHGSGSYPNSRTVSPFAFQTIQSRSPSGGSSTSSSSVNTPPGSPSAHAAASTSPQHNHLEHHHYQYASTDTLSKSPLRASRAKRRKSFGALLASGGVSSTPATPDAMSDEKMEFLSGQIVDRVRNVLLDQDRPPSSSALPSSLTTSTVSTSAHPSREMQARLRQSTVPSLSSEPNTRPTTKPAVAVRDLWMRLGMEDDGTHSHSLSSRPKSPPLAQSALPPTSIAPSNRSSRPPGASSPALLPPSSSLPTQILESVVEGCLEDFRVGIRSDIQNMHLELLRQFQIQKMGIEQLLKQYTDTKELHEENERLREENQRLRMNY